MTVIQQRLNAQTAKSYLNQQNYKNKKILKNKTLKEIYLRIAIMKEKVNHKLDAQKIKTYFNNKLLSKIFQKFKKIKNMKWMK